MNTKKLLQITTILISVLLLITIYYCTMIIASIEFNLPSWDEFWHPDEMSEYLLWLVVIIILLLIFVMPKIAQIG